MMFNERKVAQMAAFFLRECGGSMSVLKLTKLLYLAERIASFIWHADVWRPACCNAAWPCSICDL